MRNRGLSSGGKPVESSLPQSRYDLVMSESSLFDLVTYDIAVSQQDIYISGFFLLQLKFSLQFHCVAVFLTNLSISHEQK